MNTGKESGFSKQAEATLIEQAQGGSQESMDQLLLRHERLIHWVVRRQWLYILPYDAAVQEGRRGLWRAILGYEPKRGVKFSTYAYQAIMRYVWAAVKSERRRMRRRIAREVLVLYFYDPGVDPAWLREREEVADSLRELVNRLGGPQAAVIGWHYGLDGQGTKTHAEIAAQMGVSRQRIGQIETEALMWLRQPAHSQELRSILARHDQQQYELADRLAQAWLRRRGGRHGRR
jgi:RNA polymerase sigma factor (sigma-70 family)